MVTLTMASPATESDESLWDRFIAGDEGAFVRLVERHERGLLSYLTAICRDHSLAQDAFQETFLRLIRARGQFSGKNWRGYMLATARNTALNLLVQRKRFRNRLRRLQDPEPAEGEAPRTAPGEDARAALEALPDALREILTLKIDAGMTYAQIAEHLGIPAGTVGSRAAEALELLRARLAKEC